MNAPKEVAHSYKLTRTSWFRLIKRRDVHPFVLSCGIVVQGIVYAVAQSKGFQSLMILGCRSISQFMLPGKSTMVYDWHCIN